MGNVEIIIEKLSPPGIEIWIRRLRIALPYIIELKSDCHYVSEVSDVKCDLFLDQYLQRCVEDDVTKIIYELSYFKLPIYRLSESI